MRTGMAPPSGHFQGMPELWILPYIQHLVSSVASSFACSCFTRTEDGSTVLQVVWRAKLGNLSKHACREQRRRAGMDCLRVAGDGQKTLQLVAWNAYLAEWPGASHLLSYLGKRSLKSDTQTMIVHIICLRLLPTVCRDHHVYMIVEGTSFRSRKEPSC